MDVKSKFVADYIATQGLSLISKDEDKPWGGYYIYQQTDADDRKIIWIKPGQYLSLQYHGSADHPGHSEVVTALTQLKIVVGNSCMYEPDVNLERELANLDIVSLQPQENYTIQAGFMHAYVNPFDFDVYLLENRISQITETYTDRENNITRVYDQSGRDGLPQWPAELIARIESS